MAMGVSSRHTAEQDASVGRLEEATNGAEGERRRRGLFSAGFDRVSRMVVTRDGRHGEGEGSEDGTSHSVSICSRGKDDAPEHASMQLKRAIAALSARFDD